MAAGPDGDRFDEWSLDEDFVKRARAREPSAAQRWRASLRQRRALRRALRHEERREEKRRRRPPE